MQKISLFIIYDDIITQTDVEREPPQHHFTEKVTLVKSSKRTDEIEPEESAEARGPHDKTPSQGSQR